MKQSLLFPALVFFFCSCSFTKKFTYGQFSDVQICQMEQSYYPTAKGVFRIKKGTPKAQKDIQYLDIVDFISVYNKNGLLVASTGNGSCEFKTLSNFRNGALKPDSSRTVDALLQMLEPACALQPSARSGKTTVFVGSAQFLDYIPTYKSRRKLLRQQLAAIANDTTDVFVVNFDLRPEADSMKN